MGIKDFVNIEVTLSGTGISTPAGGSGPATQGTPVAQGPSGSLLALGPEGPAGPQGLTGPQGDPGSTGPVGPTPTVTGTGFWHNVSGVLQAAALIGTAGQFAVTAAGATDVAFASISGDVSASTATPGQLTVTALNTHPIVSTAPTEGQFLVQGASSWAPTSLSGDVSASVTTPGDLTVVAIQGNAVETGTLGSGQNGYVLTWVNGSSQAQWLAPATTSVTGSGVWQNTSGTLQSAALLGTAGQFLVTNSGATNVAFASISGDISASTSTVGKLTVTGLQNVALPAPSGSGTVLTYSGSTLSWASSSSVTWANDLSGNGTTTSTDQYVSALSYSSAAAGGSIAVNGTNTLLNWVTNAITLQQNGTTLLQLKAAGTDFILFGASAASGGFIRVPSSTQTIIESPAATILWVDSSGDTIIGAPSGLAVAFELGSTIPLGIVASGIQFQAPIATPSIVQLQASAAGTSLTIAAQAAGSGTHNGGDLVLESGAAGNGSSNCGTIYFGFGGTTDTARFQGASTSAGKGALTWSSGTTPVLDQDPTFATTQGASFTIQPQSSGQATNFGGGHLNCTFQVPGGTGAEAYLRTIRGSSFTTQLGPWITTPSVGALYLGNITPSGSNWAILGDGTANTQVNAPGAGGRVVLFCNNSPILYVTTTQVYINPASNVTYAWNYLTGTVNTQKITHNTQIAVLNAVGPSTATSIWSYTFGAQYSAIFKFRFVAKITSSNASGYTAGVCIGGEYRVTCSYNGTNVVKSPSAATGVLSNNIWLDDTNFVMTFTTSGATMNANVFCALGANYPGVDWQVYVEQELD